MLINLTEIQEIEEIDGKTIKKVEGYYITPKGDKYYFTEYYHAGPVSALVRAVRSILEKKRRLNNTTVYILTTNSKFDRLMNTRTGAGIFTPLFAIAYKKRLTLETKLLDKKEIK